MGLKLTDDQFEKFVAEAIEKLPGRFRAKLDNVDVIIEDKPTAERRVADDIPDNEALFGLYEGVPQTDRGDGYTFVLPDKITIFREALCEACESEDELIEEIRQTVIHEIAHHFGISDERLDELGKY